MRKIFGWYHKKDFSSLSVFTSVFAIVWLLSIAWSLATPLFGGPDEPAHVIKAATVARGEFTGELIGKSDSPFGRVLVPEYYATTRNIPTCFHRNPKRRQIVLRCLTAPKRRHMHSLMSTVIPLYTIFWSACPAYWAITDSNFTSCVF